MITGPSGPAALGLRAHVFVDDLDAPALSSGDEHHLRRVLRVAAGTDLTVADGTGRWRTARLTERAVVPTSPIVEDAPLSPPITIAFALVKGDRPEWTVQKLTELGVDRIVPFVAERSVVQIDASRAPRQVARWRRIAREAAMQCRRSRLPAVDAPMRFAEAAALEHAALTMPIGEAPSLARPTLLIGPEGGWSPSEEAAKLPRIALGPQVLRSETAAIVSGALLTALRVRLVDTTKRENESEGPLLEL